MEHYYSLSTAYNTVIEHVHYMPIEYIERFKYVLKQIQDKYKEVSSMIQIV